MKIIGAVLALCLLLPLGAFLGLQAYSRLVVGIPVVQQTAQLRLPANFTASALATQPLKIGLDGPVTAQVPIKQTLAIPVQGHYNTLVAFDTSLPLHLQLHYHGQVPVDSYVDIKGDTSLVTGEHWYVPRFALKARLPVHLMLPVDINMPVDTSLRFNYQGPMDIVLNQTLAAPVDTVLNTHLRLNDSVTAPVQASFPLRLHGTGAAVPLVIEQANLLVSPKQLGFSLH